MTKSKTVAQERAERILRKYGEQITRGKDKGKWDMSKGVEAEKDKGRKK